MIDVYLEIGKKRIFAGALDWPGWSRSGQDADSALQSLLDYGPRYAAVLRSARLGFKAPASVSAFNIVEKIKGDATTDFGAPGASPARDKKRVNETELKRFRSVLKACWQAFDAAARRAKGKELRKGPRGGGRDLDGIIRHLLGSDAGYLASLGQKIKISENDSLSKQLGQTRQMILDGLAASAHGEIPARGPRGGLRWTPSYFVRRLAWHTLDHAWEVEDRIR